MRKYDRGRHFWREVFAFRESATPVVLPRVLLFGAIAAGMTALTRMVPALDDGVEVAPYEIAGAVMAVLLVLRTNAGYERWWEARKLWGGIVNQSRNLATVALAYGPADPVWRDRVVRWTAAFAHAARRSLRGEREVPEVAALVGTAAACRVAAAEHMPGHAAAVLARLLREGLEAGMDRFAFHQAEKHRAQLIDHIGGCERILRTPLPIVYSIKIRRFLVLFLLVLPFALTPKVAWLTPLLTMFVAYPLLALDQIGHDLQNPFASGTVSPLPLADVCATIERSLLALRVEDEAESVIAVA